MYLRATTIRLQANMHEQIVLLCIRLSPDQQATFDRKEKLYGKDVMGVGYWSTWSIDVDNVFCMKGGRGKDSLSAHPTTFSLQFDSNFIALDKPVFFLKNTRLSLPGQQEFIVYCAMQDANVLVNGLHVSCRSKQAIKNGDLLDVLGGNQYIFFYREGHCGNPEFPDFKDVETVLLLIQEAH